jgi:hypothetical protein
MAVVGGLLPGRIGADLGEAPGVVGVEVRGLMGGDEAAANEGGGEVVAVVIERTADAEEREDAYNQEDGCVFPDWISGGSDLRPGTHVSVTSLESWVVAFKTCRMMKV